MTMDKRIGYGLTLREALEKAYDTIQHLEGEPNFFSIRTPYSYVWAELRDDGWRVYHPKEEGDLPVSIESDIKRRVKDA